MHKNIKHMKHVQNVTTVTYPDFTLLQTLENPMSFWIKLHKHVEPILPDHSRACRMHPSPVPSKAREHACSSSFTPPIAEVVKKTLHPFKVRSLTLLEEAM